MKAPPDLAPTVVSRQVADDSISVASARHQLGVAYLMAMGICGIVLVAIGSNLKQIAVHCGTSATRIGTVFVSRGMGAMLGAVMSSKAYRWWEGNRVMVISLSALFVLLLILPILTSVCKS